MIFSQRENFDVKNYIVPFITAISSFLTVFIVIPKIIAKYLFDNSEEAVMQKMITSIQDYDRFIRSNLFEENNIIEHDENHNNKGK